MGRKSSPGLLPSKNQNVFVGDEVRRSPFGEFKMLNSRNSASSNVKMSNLQQGIWF